MHSYLIVFSIALFGVVLLLTTRFQRKGTINFPYVRAKALFSPAERSFLAGLTTAVGSNYRVFGKVRVADIAHVKPGLRRPLHQAALNRIAAKHFDYVICRATDLTVICVVELNDRSHQTKRAQQRDAFIAQVCRTIDIPLWTVSAAMSYDISTLRNQFDALIITPCLPADADGGAIS
ncbi:DUF2726 domain-containing protein [Dyella dinghuensis]|uniref:DUF2726 domain-containing protein n=1 Tax=Dyella dinghuensis TaxID=1920169 RepID=A0A3S0PG28_9GAMM|nr:DUF2726 domain-containing protein [Dyella dinghuensis]RUL65805.1 DUF2726 domain-containing protein [Dyella dinghuensis]